MKRVIELKHVGPKDLVRTLIDELIDRLEDRLKHFRDDSLSIHVLFEENGTHKLYRTAVSCHLPGHQLAAHDEGANAGMTIRSAFKEISRQAEKHSTLVRRTSVRKRAARLRRNVPPSSRDRPRLHGCKRRPFDHPQRPWKIR